jgi:hypothetical protein
MRKLITLDPDLHRKHRMLAAARGVAIATETDDAIRRNLELHRGLLISGAKMPKGKTKP